MKYLPKKIHDALAVLKEICQYSVYCEDCPLADNPGCCILATPNSPRDWDI